MTGGKSSSTVTRKFPVNSNGLHGEVDVQLSPFGLILLTQPLHSSEQHMRAYLEFSSNFAQGITVFFWKFHFELNLQNFALCACKCDP